MRSRAILVLVAVLLSFCPDALAQRSGYWVQEGNSLRHVDGDPSEFRNVVEWQIRLYRKHDYCGSRAVHWGLITGKSPQSVQAQLERSQEWARKLGKFFGYDPEDERDTYFNPCGPIAVLEPRKSGSDRYRAEIEKAADEAGKLQEIGEGVLDIMSKEPKPYNPFSEVGKGLKGYADALVEVQKRIRGLEATLGDVSGRGLLSIDTEFGKLRRDLAKARELQTRISSLASSSDSAAWMHHEVRLRDRTVRHSVRVEQQALVVRIEEQRDGRQPDALTYRTPLKTLNPEPEMLSLTGHWVVRVRTEASGYGYGIERFRDGSSRSIGDVYEIDLRFASHEDAVQASRELEEAIRATRTR